MIFGIKGFLDFLFVIREILKSSKSWFRHLLAFLSATFVPVLKLKHGFIIGIKGNGGIERLARFAAGKAFYSTGLSVHQQRSKLRIGQVFFGDGAKHRQSAMFVVALGYLLKEYHLTVLAFGTAASGAVVGALKRNVEQFRGDLRSVHLYRTVEGGGIHLA